MFIFKEILLNEEECNHILDSNKKTNVIDDFPEYKLRVKNCIQIFKNDVLSTIKIYSWVMRYEKNQGGPWHLHRGVKGHSFSANIFLGGDPSVGLWIRDSVTKEEVLHKNKIGEIIIMDCCTYHKPEINYNSKTRCVLGITIHDIDFDLI